MDFHLVEIGPEADRLLPDPPISPLLLAIPEESAKVAGAAVVCQDNQQARAELKGARKLGVDLEDAVEEKQEDGCNKVLAFSNVRTIPDDTIVSLQYPSHYWLTWSRKDALFESILSQSKPQSHAGFLHQGQE